MHATRFLRAGSVAALALVTMAANGFAQCEITGPSEVCPGAPAQLCASAGGAFQWTGPNGFTAGTRCVAVTAPGTYTARVFDSNNALWFTCTTTLVAGSSAPPPPVISGSRDGCEGETVQLCGPAGNWNYTWTGPDGFLRVSSCIDVSAPGDYTLAIRDPAGGCGSSATVSVAFAPCGGGGEPLPNCPRTPAWWARQCRPSTRAPQLPAEVLADVVTCADDRATSLAFADAAEFCDLLAWNHRADARVQARRQLAALFANLCANEQGLTAPNGAPVGVAASAEVKFEDGPATTVGAWAEAADARVASLAGRSASNRGVRRQLERIAWNAALLNTGAVVETQCKGAPTAERFAGEPALDAAWGLAEDGADLAAPTPNPFRGRTSVMLSVTDAAGAEVDLAVHDLAGRRVRTLLSGRLAAGPHEATWDGRTDRGEAATPGMYFLRGRVGDQTLVRSVILAK